MTELWKSYETHRKAFALRKGDLSFDDMREQEILGVFGYIAVALSAAFCLLFGGPWLWSMPWHLVGVEFSVISVAILGFGVAGLDTCGRLNHMWKMNHDPVYRKKQDEWNLELSKWLDETEWMVTATREINELAASCRKGVDGANCGRKSCSDGDKSGPKLRVTGISDVS